MDSMCNVSFFTPSAATLEQNSQQQSSRTPVSMHMFVFRKFINSVTISSTKCCFLILWNLQSPFLGASSQHQAIGQEQPLCRAKNGNFKCIFGSNPSIIQVLYPILKALRTTSYTILLFISHRKHTNLFVQRSELSGETHWLPVQCLLCFGLGVIRALQNLLCLPVSLPESPGVLQVLQ